MNLREGRVGRQESIAAAVIMLTASGLFAAAHTDLSAGGNSAYRYLPFSLLLGLAVFLTVFKTHVLQPSVAAFAIDRQAKRIGFDKIFRMQTGWIIC